MKLSNIQRVRYLLNIKHTKPLPDSPHQDRQTLYILTAETVTQSRNPSLSIHPQHSTPTDVHSYTRNVKLHTPVKFTYTHKSR